MPKTIYLVSADYGGMENWFEAAFTDEVTRNEIALEVAQEIEHANFNLNVAAWITSGYSVERAIQIALRESKYEGGYSSDSVATWEVPLYD